jgi:hypothetical protein
MGKLTLEALRSLGCRDVESFIGINGYASRTPGIGGIIKKVPEDFHVWEIIEGGLDAQKLWLGEKSMPIIGTKNLLLVMKKRDRETIKAISQLSSMFGILPSQISACGIKDRRALTWQFISMPYTPKISGEIVLYDAWVRPVGSIDALSSKSLIRNNFWVKDQGVKRCLRRGSQRVFRRAESERRAKFFRIPEIWNCASNNSPRRLLNR